MTLNHVHAIGMLNRAWFLVRESVGRPEELPKPTQDALAIIDKATDAVRKQARAEYDRHRVSK